jgi:energy-coupling factor transport system ATP-binding protein
VLRLEGVSYRYPGTKRDALAGVSLELAEGTITGLAGANESGKSTLCLVAGGLAPRVVGGRLVGDLVIDGQRVANWPMHQLSELVVTGLQDPAGQLSLVADTVLEEVAYGPANLGLPRDEVWTRAEAALEQVDISDLRERDPVELSGGQQQLVVLAGLLAMGARHLILDEPVAHLDAHSTGLVLKAIAATAAAGTAVLIAEQRIEALEQVCDSLAVVASGNVVSHGPISSVLANPAVQALGVHTGRGRISRRLREAGLDGTRLEPAP